MNIAIIESRRLWETDQSVQITDKGITIQVEGVSETFDFTEFTEDGDYVLEDCMILPYNPVQSIKKDGDGFVVSVFYDNPFEYVEDWTPPFERKGQGFKPVKELPYVRIAEIDTRLLEIDKESVRPTRAMMAGTATEQDTWKVNELEQEAILLREERANLLKEV